MSDIIFVAILLIVLIIMIIAIWVYTDNLLLDWNKEDEENKK